MLQAALAYLEEARTKDDPESAEVYDDLSQHYKYQLATIGEGGSVAEGGLSTDFHIRFNDLSRALVRVERQTAVRLRNERRISDELLRHLEHELDLSELRLSAKSR
jgi:hypothetical protein